MRLLLRLTNAFSKKRENLWAAYWLHFAHYNFCRIHRSLRVTPAMEAGIAAGPWELSDLLAVMTIGMTLWCANKMPVTLFCHATRTDEYDLIS